MTVGIQPDHTLKRDFRLWSSFAFAFAFISPIVALYGIFGLAITTAGPSFWWAFPLVFGGQLLVAMVFATLVSRWPIEGSIYQWSRRLVGTAYGWFAGWAYMWTLVIAMATACASARAAWSTSLSNQSCRSRNSSSAAPPRLQLPSQSLRRASAFRLPSTNEAGLMA